MTKGVFVRRIYEREIQNRNGEYHVGDLRKYVASQLWSYHDLTDRDHPFAARVREDLKEDEMIGLLAIPVYHSDNSFDLDGEPYYVVFDHTGKYPKRIVYVATEYCACDEPVSDEKAVTDFTEELHRLKELESTLRKALSEQENVVKVSVTRMADEGELPSDESTAAFIAAYGILKQRKNEYIECRIEIRNLEKRIRHHQKCISKGNRTKVLIPQTGIGLF